MGGARRLTNRRRNPSRRPPHETRAENEQRSYPRAGLVSDRLADLQGRNGGVLVQVTGVVQQVMHSRCPAVKRGLLPALPAAAVAAPADGSTVYRRTGRWPADVAPHHWEWSFGFTSGTVSSTSSVDAFAADMSVRTVRRRPHRPTWTVFPLLPALAYGAMVRAG